MGKEKNVFEIKFRDIPREQENTPGNPKQKEEKKEVFTKVGSREFAMCRIVYAAWKTDMEARRKVGSFQHRGQRQTAGYRTIPLLLQTVRYIYNLLPV